MKEQLQAKEKNIKERYDALTAQQQDITNEKLRLEGEFRLVTGWLEEIANEEAMKAEILKKEKKGKK